MEDESMKRLKVKLLLFCVIMLLFGVAPSALGIVVGFNSDIHMDITNVPEANDFHVEGRIESGDWGGNWSKPPTLVSHIDGNFPNFSYTIAPDPCDPGQNWYTVTADWWGYNYHYCNILHLGLFFDATCHNVVYDLVGWWTKGGLPIPPVPIPPPVNGGAVPVPGFRVLDQNQPQVVTFRNDSQLFGGGGGGGGGAGIYESVVGMDMVSLTKEELEMHLGPIPEAFGELRLGGKQQYLPWVQVENYMGPISEYNPISFQPDSFFDVFLDVSGPIHTMVPIPIPQSGFLVSRARVGFTNNNGQYEYRWVWHIHEAHPPKPPAEHLKWSQPPIETDPCTIDPVYCGWNESSWTQDPCGLYISHAAADDFRCIGSMPVTSIHWWGSFMNWTTRVLPPQMPSGWNVKFFANVPAGMLPYSHPGAVLWEVNIPNNRVQTEWNGNDYFPNMQMESCFQHYVDLNPEEYFNQDDYNDLNNIYWLGITAVYPQGINNYPWGWKTRPAHWMDDAVHYERIPSPTGPIWEYWPLTDPYTGESMDLAFELDTDPNYIKWEQPYTGIRNWPHYDDELSMATEYGPSLNIIRQAADDWLCTKRMPVTAIVWWGSYLWYNYQPCISSTTPQPIKPDYFLINIWTDVPVGDPCNPNTFSCPGQKVWEYKAYDYDQVLVGYDKQPEGMSGPPREAVFRYSVRLPENKYFKQKQVNKIFWISIVAVYQNNYPDYQWGWTNHKHFYNDDAVSGYWDYSGPPEPEWKWEEIFDQTGASADLSFMLFTDPNKCYSCADYDSSGLINFKDFAQFALEWMWSGLPGGYNKADLNCDGNVNYEDLEIFCDQWLQSCPP
jgi:hypothetical protein